MTTKLGEGATRPALTEAQLVAYLRNLRERLVDLANVARAAPENEFGQSLVASTITHTMKAILRGPEGLLEEMKAASEGSTLPTPSGKGDPDGSLN